MVPNYLINNNFISFEELYFWRSVYTLTKEWLTIELSKPWVFSEWVFNNFFLEIICEINLLIIFILFLFDLSIYSQFSTFYWHCTIFIIHFCYCIFKFLTFLLLFSFLFIFVLIQFLQFLFVPFAVVILFFTMWLHIA